MERMSHPPAIVRSMQSQLVLIEEPAREWRLDEETRRAGRRGLELARQALVEAQRRAAA